MADPAGMFDKIAEQRRKKAQPSSKSEPKPKQRQRKTTGKRSDPNYVQVGAYIPKELNKAVKRKLVDADKDFSDLMTELLEAWVKEQDA